MAKCESRKATLLPWWCQDSRALQVTLFGTLQKKVGTLDFSLLLPDVMTIADVMDSQLTQAMEGYVDVAEKPAAA